MRIVAVVIMLALQCHPVAASDWELPASYLDLHTSATAFAHGGLWIGVVSGEVWRLDSSGVSRKYRLPNDAYTAQMIVPENENTALVTMWGQVYRLSPAGAEAIADLSNFVGRLVPVEHGYIGPSLNGDDMLYFRVNEGVLESPVVVGRKAGALRVYPFDATRVVSVKDHPYTILITSTDGADSEVPVDDSHVRALAPSLRAGQPLRVQRRTGEVSYSVVRADSWLDMQSVRTDAVFVSDVDSLVLRRSVQERSAAGSSSREFIDIVDSSSGQVRQRLDWTNVDAEGWRWVGAVEHCGPGTLRGVRGIDLVIEAVDSDGRTPSAKICFLHPPDTQRTGAHASAK